jgi:hypothetical protein
MAVYGLWRAPPWPVRYQRPTVAKLVRSGRVSSPAET